MAAPVIGPGKRFARPGSTVDRTHPLASGLEFCYVPTVGHVDLSRRVGSTVAGTVGPETSQFGPASRVSNSRVTFDGLPDAAFTGAITVVWAGTILAYTAANAGFVFKGTSQTATLNNPFSFIHNFNGGLSLRRSSATNSILASTSQSNLVGSGFRGVLIASAPDDISSAWTAWFWINGTFYAPSASALTNPVSGADASMSVGNATANEVHATSLAAVWSRQISQDEAALLTADPFCFLKV